MLWTDVLEYIPIEDVPSTLHKISSLVKEVGDVFLVIIARDLSKQENHQERSSDAEELKQIGLKIHETVKPRSLRLIQLSNFGLEEDKKALGMCFCEQISRKFMILVINSPQYVNLMVIGT